MQEISLNQNTFSLFPSVYAVQNDTGRELKMVLTDRTLLATDTATVAVNRSDGSYYTITGTVDTATNSVTADITQALTQPGRTLCQLKITDTNDLVVSSYTFCIMVQPSTDGVPQEQLGWSVEDIIEAAQTIMSGGFSTAFKNALLQIASKVVYIDEHGQDYYDALESAMDTIKILSSISAVYDQSVPVYDIYTVDDLKANLTVTATYTDSSTATISGADYTLSGSLVEGTSTITVSYEDKTTTFTVTVLHDLDVVPLDYTKKDYIINNVTGSSATNLYIDTGLGATYGTQDYEHEIVYANNTSSTSASSIYGLRLASGNINNSRTVWVKSNNNQVIYANHDSGYTYASNLNEKIKIKTTADANNAYVYVNDVQQYSGSKTTFEPVSGGNFHLFGVRQGGGSTNAGMLNKAKIYSFKVKNISNSEYVAYFVPCINSNSVAGFYDTVRKQFYTTSSSTMISGDND